MTMPAAVSHLSATPKPTKVFLVATLAVTALAVGDVLRRASGSGIDARTTGYFLLAFTLLFAARVGGQVVVLRRSPGWLPPMGQWNLVPYRLLLPIQLVFLAVMAAIDSQLLSQSGRLATSAPAAGRVLIGFSVVYAVAMIVRYAVRMRRRAEQRWFGGAVPIVFHIVLAAYLLTLGVFHAAG